MLCYHCHLPVPPGVDLQVTIRGASQPMCCVGCQAVASAIVDGGLARFYKYRSGQQQRPNADRLDSYAAYDLSAVQEEFVEPLDDEQGTAEVAVELLVEGIGCAACAWLIERHLGRIKGVKKVVVNVTSHRCWVEWDNRQVALSTVLRAMSHIGYRARPAGDEAIREARSRENRRALQRLGVAGIGMMQAGMLAVALYAGAFDDIEPQWRQFLRWVSMAIATPVVSFSAAPFFQTAWRSLKARHLVMDVPVSLAIALAYTASAWATISGTGEVYFDSVSMFTFFLLAGRYLEMRVRHRNELSMEGLGQLLPPVATRVRSAAGGRPGADESVPVKALQPGELVRVAPGDVIPCDGIIRDGISHVVEAVLTGEQQPVRKASGDAVNAGTLNNENPLLIEVRSVGRQTRLSAILRLVQNAQMEKPTQVALADRVAGYFVGFVLVAASGVFLFWWQKAPDHALWVTLSVLVVTCPCALSLATPAVLAVATQQMRKSGLLVGRGHVIGGMGRADRVVFDKTGTLTTGRMSIARVVASGGCSEKEMLAIAATLEAGSRHPIAAAFLGCGQELSATAIDNRIGSGVVGLIDHTRYAIGQASWIGALFGHPIELSVKPASGELWLLLASEAAVLGWIVLRDQLRSDAVTALEELRALGLETELLSGDRPEAVAALAEQLGMDCWRSGASPEQKLAHIRELQSRGHKVLMVGDGINDVPVLGGADVSVAMGEAADVTRLHADSVLMSGQLRTLARAIALARRCGRVIAQNVVWALIYNLLALPLAAMGWIPPWAAALGMSVSSLAVVLNAVRLKHS